MLRNKADAWRGSYFEHGLPVVLQTIKYEFGTLASERTQVKLQDDRPSQIKNDVSKTPFYMLSLRPPTILTTNRWKNNEAADIVASLLDFLLQNTGKVIIGSFSIVDRGGKENVTLKMKIQNCRVYSNSLKMSNLGGFPWRWFLGDRT